MRVARRLSLSLSLAICASSALGKDAPSQDDIRLSLAARTAISEDLRFFYLNLGIPVKNGVATVWGVVPSADATQQIVDRVGKVKGIKRVKNEMTVLPEDEWPDEWRSMQPLLRPLGQKPRPGEQIAVSLRPPTPFDATPQGTPAPSAPPAIAAPASPMITPVLPMSPMPVPVSPMPMSSGQLAAQEHKPDLRSAIDSLQKSDPRFDGIAVSLDGAIVYVRGQGPILFTLAERLSVLPGVERVVVQMPPR